MLFSEKTHYYIYYLGLVLFAIALSTSVFLMSVSQFIIYINWILEGNFKTKWQRIKSNKWIWLFSSVFLVHLIWTFFPQPQDYNYALNDLRIKLPLLLFPLFVGSANRLSLRNIKNILFVFVATVTIVGIIGIVRYILKDSLNIVDYRHFVPFISHVRFSLMIVFSIFILIHFYLSETNNRYRFIFLLLTAFLVFTILILRVHTGIMLLTILIVLYTSYYIFFVSKNIFKWALLFAIVLSLSYFFYQTSNIYNEFLLAYRAQPPSNVVTNENHKPYYFIEESKDVENGQRVYFYIIEEEMINEWNKRSAFKYHGYDTKGNKIKHTLVRYLTSKGLTKDSAGISKLTNEDIKAIEKGIPNYIYLKNFSPYAYIYSFVWEFYNYIKLGKVNGSSLFQRIEYQKIAISIIKDHFWTGVGTGNVQQAFDEKYKQVPTNLKDNFRHRAHNQYLTFLLTFGIYGFLWVMVALIVPYFKKSFTSLQLIKVTFIIICLISFITEDTLETQAGVSFIVYFYSLFTFTHVQES